MLPGEGIYYRPAEIGDPPFELLRRFLGIMINSPAGVTHQEQPLMFFGHLSHARRHLEHYFALLVFLLLL